jgi:predicted site-specific integrase-resolvase
LNKAYTTPKAAKLIGVSVITVYRWLAAGKIKPKGIELGDGRMLWQWSDADISKGKDLKLAPGRPLKPKAKK